MMFGITKKYIFLSCIVTAVFCSSRAADTPSCQKDKDTATEHRSFFNKPFLNALHFVPFIHIPYIAARGIEVGLKDGFKKGREHARSLFLKAVKGTTKRDIVAGAAGIVTQQSIITALAYFLITNPKFTAPRHPALSVLSAWLAGNLVITAGKTVGIGICLPIMMLGMMAQMSLLALQTFVTLPMLPILAFDKHKHTKTISMLEAKIQQNQKLTPDEEALLRKSKEKLEEIERLLKPTKFEPYDMLDTVILG